MAVAQTAGNQGKAGMNPKTAAALANGQQGQTRTAPGSGEQVRQPETSTSQIAVARQQERALVPVPVAENHGIVANATTFGAQIARLPVELDVSIPLRDFRVRDLLALEPGRLIESEWSNGVDLPLAAGQVQLAWTEFEVIETDLVVRLTRLA
jgi:flagellar motor switch protein FliN/FliY